MKIKRILYKNILVYSLTILMLGSVYSAAVNKHIFDLEQTGELFFRAYRDITEDNSLEDKGEFDTRVKLHNKLLLSQKDLSFILDIEGRGEIFLREDKTDKDWDFLLREAYASWNNKKFAVSIGKQIITWGKLDDVVILDRISPQDYKWFVLLDKQVRKDPIFMFKLDYYGENYDLEGVFLPFFTPSYLRFFGSDWSVFDHIMPAIEEGNFSSTVKDIVRNISILDKDKFEKRTLANSQLGFRVRKRILDTDYGFYYMSIYNSLPTLREKTSKGNIVKKFLYLPTQSNLNDLIGVNPAGDDLILEREFSRTNVLGSDFETVLAQFGVRGEAALLLDMPYLKNDFSYVRKNTFSLGLGADKKSSTNLYCNLQLINDYIFNYEKLFFNRKNNFRVTNTITQDFLREKLIFNVGSSFNFSRHDWMLNPKITYKFNNGLETSLGGFIFEGALDTLFGRYSAKDPVYLEITHHF